MPVKHTSIRFLMKVLCLLFVNILRFLISPGIMILNGLLMVYLNKLHSTSRHGSKHSRLKDSRLKSSNTKAILPLFLLKLLEMFKIRPSSSMAILISSHHLQDGMKTRGQPNQLYKMESSMAEEEPMMAIALTHQCLLLKQFKNKDYLFQVRIAVFRDCYDY